MEIETLSMEYVDMKTKQIWLGNSLPAILSFCISTVCVYSPPWSLLHTYSQVFLLYGMKSRKQAGF